MNIHSHAGTSPRSRGLLVDRVENQGWAVGDAAEAMGISTRTVRKWLRRYREHGPAGLLDRSSRPHRMPNQLSVAWQDQILQLRRMRKTGAQIASSLKLPRSTVARVLKRHGVSRLSALDPKPKVVRYEWPEPGDMLHIDTKKLGRIHGVGHRITGDRTGQSNNRGVGWEYVFLCIDDASRVAYVEVLDQERGPQAAAFLERATAWFAERGVTAKRVLTDNGTCFRRLFDAACIRLGIRHLRTRPYTPKTNGKAERLVQTLLREWAYARPYTSSARRTRALEPWLRYYNLRRNHGSLGSTPMARLTRVA